MFSHLSTIFVYLRRYRLHLFAGLVAVALHNAMGLITPLVLRRAIDGLREGLPLSEVWTYAGLVVALTLGAGIFLFLMRRTVIWASRKMEFDLRGDLFAHLLTLSSSYFDRTATGEILSRASADVEAVRLMLGPGIMYSFNALIVALGAIPFMFYLDWQLALYTLLPLPIISLAVNRVGTMVHHRFMAIQQHFALLSSHAQESLAGIRVIKSGSHEHTRHHEFVKHNDTYFALNMKLIQVQGFFRPLLYFLAGLAVVAVLYFGGRSVIAGRITLGSFVAFTLYLGMLIWPMIALGWVVSLYQRGTASLKRIDQIFATSSDVADRETLPEPPEFDGTIEIKGLSFAYPTGGREVLQDLSLQVRAGETLALVGDTGSGKTTLLKLLTRTYPVPDGCIFIGGVDLNLLPLSRLRSLFAVVAQEPFLFSAALTENLAFGLDTPLNEDRLAELAKAVDIDDEIAGFPNGWSTIIGERGITLSGGQKQRVSLARALAVDRKVLILDDAFSSVDTHTEENILNHLSTLVADCTVLMVSHRISTARRADRIVVLDEGRITESGTHDTLVALGGRYAELAQKQALREQLAAI